MSNGLHRGMASVFVEWSGDIPTERCGMPESSLAACSSLHRVRWRESFISSVGGRQICHFHAPDAESVRLALRQAGVAARMVWTGTVYHDPGYEESAPGTANVVVEHEFLQPLPEVAARTLQHLRHWLAPRGLRLAVAVISQDRRRVLCLCEAGSGTEVHGNESGERGIAGWMWPCRRVSQDSPATADGG